MPGDRQVVFLFQVNWRRKRLMRAQDQQSDSLIAKAQALSTSNRLPHLVPNLVEAMFTDFPGNSGETVRISIAPEKKTVRRID